MVRFRPSSHSEDGTVVAVFKSEAAAKRAAAQCGGRHFGRKVKFFASNAEYGTLNRVSDSMWKAGAEKVFRYLHYQELIIEVRLPAGVRRETIPLVCDSDTAAIIRHLEALCGKPEEVVTRRSRKLIFRYAGDKRIFRRASKRWGPPRDEFWFDDKVYYPSKAFRVRGLV